MQTQKKITTIASMSDSFVEFCGFWLTAMTVVFGALAAMTGVGAWWFSDRASKIKDDKLVRYQQDSAEKISLALERVAKSESVSAAANERASANELARVQMEKQVEELRKENAVLQTKAVKVENTLRWRTITPEQWEIFAAALVGAPRGKVELLSVSQDSECRAFGAQIHQMLVSNGFDAGAVSSWISGGNDVPTGVAIGPSNPKHAALLRAAFIAIGINITPGDLHLGGKEDVVLIMIGQKPPE